MSAVTTQQQNQEMQNAFLAKKENQYVPAGNLDQVLCQNASNFTIDLYTPEGGVLGETGYITSAIELIRNKTYTHTDHLILVLKNGNHIVIYVSLDNSVRANISGFPLKGARLNNIAAAIRDIMAIYENNKVVLCCSEAGRPSFDGGMDAQENRVEWKEMAATIANISGLQYRDVFKNNDHEMAFGIAVFTSPDLTLTMTGHNLLGDNGFGSAAVQISVPGFANDIIAVHFPVDFHRQGADNYGAITMASLLELIGSTNAVAFGDMNLIRDGGIRDAITAEMASFNKDLDTGKQITFRIPVDLPTFYGAFFDTVNVPPEQQASWAPVEGAIIE